MKIAHCAAGAVLLASLAGCGGSSTTGDSADPGGAASKYTQTWAKNYSDTTCSEWNADMSGDQRFAAAADMLAAARNKGDGGTGLPPDSLITSFELDVTEGCSVPATADTQSVAETGASIYLIGREQYRP